MKKTVTQKANPKDRKAVQQRCEAKPVMSETKHSPYPPKELSDQALSWIVRLHSGETAKGDWEAFRAWRRQSADHEAAALEAEILWSDASDLHRDPSSGLIRPGRTGSGPSRRSVLGGIAGLATLGATGMWAKSATRSWRFDHATAVAETRIIPLADGSRVTLNAMSAIDVDYSPGMRRVALLEGEAFFEVTANRTRPFVVDVRGTRVQALGTAFDVAANLPDNRVAVTVTEHSVRIAALRQAENASLPQDHLVVSEGERVIISADGRASEILRQDPSAAMAWRTGMYIAEDRRLEEVIAAFNAYHDGWIVLQGERVKALRVNAVLDLRTPDASLDALAMGLPIKVRHISRFLTVITAS